MEKTINSLIILHRNRAITVRSRSGPLRCMCQNYLNSEASDIATVPCKHHRCHCNRLHAQQGKGKSRSFRCLSFECLINSTEACLYRTRQLGLGLWFFFVGYFHAHTQKMVYYIIEKTVQARSVLNTMKKCPFPHTSYSSIPQVTQNPLLNVFAAAAH